MKMYEMSKISPQNNLNDTTQFREDLKEIYIEKIYSKNPEISVSSRNNPEISQCSSDVPIVVNFSIYIFP